MSNEQGVRLDGLRVLIVDDAPDNRLLVSKFLQLAGAETETASDGAHGIVLALSGHFDLILMDIQMPGMDGYEAVRRLRAHDYSRPIIALTAHAMRHERDRCLTNGFDAYLTKPISRLELLKTIRTLADGVSDNCSALTRCADIPQDQEPRL